MAESSKHRTYKLYLLLAIAVLIPLFVIKQIYFPAKNIMEGKAEYVGRESCVECHATEFNDFIGSDHDLAMDTAIDATVKGNFDNASITRPNGEIHKAYKKDGRYYVLTDGEDGSMKEYEVKYVFGHEPLQNYLVEFPGGRLQTLALTWSVKDSAWFYMADSVYRDINVSHDNWLHWTNQSQNWNSMCAFCHSTDLVKGYDSETDSYHTTWSEIDVSCEACHGPASLHLEWADLPKYAQDKYENYGLVSRTSGLSSRQFVEQCARCHARRGTLSDLDPTDTSMSNFMLPSLPMSPHFHVDGQIMDEDYVFASFTQSKMFQRDVKCSDCHNVHSGQLLMEGNALCLQCHKASDYDTYEHHFHQAEGGAGEAVVSAYGDTYEVGSGAQCINCHMPAQYYMGVDLRNDHSFRVPRPDLSDELGTPNACTQCHGDKTNRWAAEHIEQWHGKQRKTHFGVAVHNAINGKAGADSALLDIINNGDDIFPANVRGIAFYYLNQEQYKGVFFRNMTSDDPTVRGAALRAFNLVNIEDAKDIFPMLSDKSKSIRIDAVMKLANFPRNEIPEKYRDAFASALEDFGDAQKYNADFPTGKFNLGNYYTIKSSLAGNVQDSIAFSEKAEKFFVKAYEQDTAMSEFALQLAYTYNNKNDLRKSATYFKKYLDAVPDNASVQYDFGLLLSTIGTQRINSLQQQNPSLAEKHRSYDLALQHLEKAIELDPSNPAFNVNNISQIYLFYGDKTKAKEVLKSAISLRPNNLNDYFNLLQYYANDRNKTDAEALAREIVAKFPDNPNAQQLKGWKLQ